ncbi:LPS-assembly protein LptD [Rhizobium alvei]|uniref:LPS-assembly protein LptD n=1 Tax=Rhizobium alvei TaxID=1132659 RepID=A0ABT8YJ05_9HYPH|nr:LPS-assembly protein LptD [Rhizobium alvei]MDO6963679.1 LPS-assembly protein LptD [Rhizobium alvei]
MAAGNRKVESHWRTALLAGAATAVLALLLGNPAQAQSAPEDDSKLLLTSSELVYDQDSQKVVAVGGVQMNYNGYKLVAKRVEYDQKSGRMMAIGDIEFIEPGGNRVYADKLDVTDDFANGFVEALRIETVDDTRLAAPRAERINGEEMVLYNGVYTACKPCAENPGKAPLWQVKAQKVIQNGKTHTIRLENARFELFGQPIAFLPVLQVPDHTVKRKSGFLFPKMSSAENLGFGFSIPYYQVISDTMDATVTTTGYTKQGVLLEAEFRQKFELGMHTLRVAGINQLNADAFTSGTSDALVNERGMIASKAEFDFNERWKLGWDVMVQSDNNFARTYSIDGHSDPVNTNQIYLTGIGERNFLDVRSYYFDVQDADSTNLAEHQQAVVHPVVDYTYYSPQPILGGQLSITTNFTSLSRTTTDYYNVINRNAVTDRFRGLAGNSSRFTSEAEWKRTFITPFGLSLTPLLAARGDGFQLNTNNPYKNRYDGDFYSDSNATRSMLTAGLEARYPILMTTDNSTHIIEPVVQIYARPDEQYAGGLPNEDAQSFVFDATNLFERDKFSGYDRVEGGTRMNAGIRYTGTFDSGYTLKGIVGQSFQLAGENSFASADLVNVGADSGLETKRSDYVGAVGVSAPNGLSVTLGGRADEKDLSIRRSDATLAYNSKILQTEITYSQIAAQPDYGFPNDNDEIQTTSAIKIKDNWSVFGSMTWDINRSMATRRGIGFSYDDSCTVFSIGFNQTRDIADTSANDWEIGARLSFRTLGDVTVGDSSLYNNQ